MFENIPQSRLLLYLLVLGILPVVISLFIVMNQRGSVNSSLAFVENIQTQAYLNDKRQAVNVAIIEHYRDADKFYIDKNLETLTFLEPEIRGLTKVVDNKNFAGDEKIYKRLEFLTSAENRLLFSEGPAEVYPHFQESTAALAHAVQINISDLKKILSLIEGVDIEEFKPGLGRPQMLITDFELSKKQINEGNDVLSLNMKVLKREFQQ